MECVLKDLKDLRDTYTDALVNNWLASICELAYSRLKEAKSSQHTSPHHHQPCRIILSFTTQSIIMSGLLNKLMDQMSEPKQSQGSQQSSSSGLLHKVTDAMSGQKHPQDYQNQHGAQMGPGHGAGPGYGAGLGYGAGPGYPQSGKFLPYHAAFYILRLGVTKRKL